MDNITRNNKLTMGIFSATVGALSIAVSTVASYTWLAIALLVLGFSLFILSTIIIIAIAVKKTWWIE